MNALLRTGGAGVGIFPANEYAYFYNRSGSTMALGDVVMVDCVTGPQTESASTDPGGEGTSVFSNVDAPTAAGIKYGVLAVCVEQGGVADNAKGRFCLCGVLDDVYVIDAADSVAIGDPLVATTAKNLDAVIVGGAGVHERIVGIALEALTTPSTRTLGKVWFNGLPGGFGMSINHADV